MHLCVWYWRTRARRHLHTTKMCSLAQFAPPRIPYNCPTISVQTLDCVLCVSLCFFFRVAISFFIHDQDQCLHLSWPFGRACGANLLDSKVSHRSRFSFSFVQIIRTDKPRNNNGYFMQIELITTNLQSHRWRFHPYTKNSHRKIVCHKRFRCKAEWKCCCSEIVARSSLQQWLVLLLSAPQFTVHTLTKNYLNQQRSQRNLGQIICCTSENNCVRLFFVFSLCHRTHKRQCLYLCLTSAFMCGFCLSSEH